MVKTSLLAFFIALSAQAAPAENAPATFLKPCVYLTHSRCVPVNISDRGYTASGVHHKSGKSSVISPRAGEQIVHRSDSDETVVFVGINVITMTSKEVLMNQTVVVHGAKITQIGQASQIEVPEDAVRIDGSAQYLMPGLTDGHVHLDAWLGARPEFGDAALFLASGVTTVFNLGGFPEVLEWRRRIRSAEILAPNLYTAGEFINEPRVTTPDDVEREVARQVQEGYDILKIHEIMDSHHHYVTTIGLSRAALDHLCEASRRYGIPLVGHVIPEIGLRTALENHENLAHIWEYFSGYFLPRQARTFQKYRRVQRISLALLIVSCLGWLLAAAVRKIRRRPAPHRPPAFLMARRLLVALTVMGILLGLAFTSYFLEWLGEDALIFVMSAAGVGCFVAGIAFVALTVKICVQRAAPLPAVLHLVVLSLATLSFVFTLSYFLPLSWRSTQHGIADIAIATHDAHIYVMTTLVGGDIEEFADDPEIRLLTNRKVWSERISSNRNPNVLIAVRDRHNLWFAERIISALRLAQVPLLLGTDAFGAPGVLPGHSVEEELELLERSGLSPYEALRTATVNPAAFLGRSNEFGQVAVGERADLLLLSGNPLQDLKVLRKPKGVMLRGRWLPSEKLHAMLSELAEH
jgi:predicted amidohydrolase